MSLRCSTNQEEQRPVNWILWSAASEIAIIVIPEEAELLMSHVKKSGSQATLLTYAAPITRKMVPLFNNLSFHAIPALPLNWVAPMWLRIELGIFAGRLYFSYDEYAHVLDFLGVKSEVNVDESNDDTGDRQIDDKVMMEEEEANNDDSIDGYIQKGEKQETDAAEEAEADIEEEISITASEEAVCVPIPVERKPLTRRPLAFLTAWLNMRRKGQDISENPMGFICAGKQLHESHPFFLRPEHEEIRKEISAAHRSGNDDEDDEDDKEVVVDNVYENVYREEDTFNDADLLDMETKEERK